MENRAGWFLRLPAILKIGWISSNRALPKYFEASSPLLSSADTMGFLKDFKTIFLLKDFRKNLSRRASEKHYEAIVKAGLLEFQSSLSSPVSPPENEPGISMVDPGSPGTDGSENRPLRMSDGERLMYRIHTAMMDQAREIYSGFFKYTTLVYVTKCIFALLSHLLLFLAVFCCIGFVVCLVSSVSVSYAAIPAVLGVVMVIGFIQILIFYGCMVTHIIIHGQRFDSCLTGDGFEMLLASFDPADECSCCNCWMVLWPIDLICQPCAMCCCSYEITHAFRLCHPWFPLRDTRIHPVAMEEDEVGLIGGEGDEKNLNMSSQSQSQSQEEEEEVAVASPGGPFALPGRWEKTFCEMTQLLEPEVEVELGVEGEGEGGENETDTGTPEVIPIVTQQLFAVRMRALLDEIPIDDDVDDDAGVGVGVGVGEAEEDTRVHATVVISDEAPIEDEGVALRKAEESEESEESALPPVRVTVVISDETPIVVEDVVDDLVGVGNGKAGESPAPPVAISDEIHVDDIDEEEVGVGEAEKSPVPTVHAPVVISDESPSVDDVDEEEGSGVRTAEESPAVISDELHVDDIDEETGDRKAEEFSVPPVHATVVPEE